MARSSSTERPARDLLTWNGVFPDVRVVEEEGYGATPAYMIVADYGWAERILCGGCYEQDAEAIAAAIREVGSAEGPARIGP